MAVPRTHDNVYLLGLLVPAAGAALEDACALLAEYGVGPRYPGVAIQRTREDAQDALTACGLVCGWARERIGGVVV